MLKVTAILDIEMNTADNPLQNTHSSSTEIH